MRSPSTTSRPSGATSIHHPHRWPPCRRARPRCSSCRPSWRKTSPASPAPSSWKSKTTDAQGSPRCSCRATSWMASTGIWRMRRLEAGCGGARIHGVATSSSRRARRSSTVLRSLGYRGVSPCMNQHKQQKHRDKAWRTRQDADAPPHADTHTKERKGREDAEATQQPGPPQSLWMSSADLGEMSTCLAFQLQDAPRRDVVSVQPRHTSWPPRRFENRGRTPRPPNSGPRFGRGALASPAHGRR